MRFSITKYKVLHAGIHLQLIIGTDVHLVSRGDVQGFLIYMYTVLATVSDTYKVAL